MNNNPGRCFAALADLIHHENASIADCNEERFIVVPIVEVPLSYNALNSPEILYLDGTNQILLRCINGLTMVFDATFENTAPLATYRLNPNARIIYNKNSGTLAVADSKMLCLRQDYGGTFLIKTALKRPSYKTVSVELPLDEATKFLQIVANDPDSEDILKHRPALRKFMSQLRTVVGSLSCNTMESVVVEVNGKELLEQLRPLETPEENNSAEVPPEWMTFIWPYISMLGERVRLMLNPDHPYNFDYSPEWKGLNKEMMASEAARRLTFQNWPHMDYRWALPCQMAEAGFYHQPNNAGDDRVLCFSCFVCLVCWEPSDEPWSEHERHSPKCRFVHNYTNPNVPFVLTMSALSPFLHHLQVNHTSSLVFSTGSGAWIAIASKESAEIHLWRTDSVVQVKQWFTLSSGKFFSAVLDCMMVEGDQPPRRTQRVTWSDDLTNCLLNVDGEEESQQSNTIKESLSDECLLKPALSTLLADVGCETVITALCTIGKPCLSDCSIGAVTKKSSEQNQTLVVVAVSVNDEKLSRVRQQSQSSLETEINTLNTMNKAHEFIDVSPRIVGGSCFGDEGVNSGASLRPFLALYQLDCADSISLRKRTSSIRQEDAKPTENKMMHSSNAGEANFSEGVILMDTTDNTVLEWADAAYGEHSGFVDLPAGEENENEVLDGPSKTDAKYDVKTDYVSVNYEAPSMDISFVQCFRLPTTVDNTNMEISAVIPMQNIFLVVIANNTGSTLDTVQSAILIYLVHFGKITANVQREPIKAYYYKDFRIVQFALANMDLVHASHGSLNSESLTNVYFDGAVIRTMEDMVYFINLNTNKLYSLCDEKVAQFAVMDTGKVTLLTKNSGKLITVQIEQSSSHRTDYEEDEDAAVAALFSKMSDSLQSEVSKNIDGDTERAMLSGGNSTANVLTSEYLSTAGLRRIWKLTRSDVGGPVRSTSYRLPHHFGGQTGYHLIPPSGWSEVPANQRIRKYFIENVPLEGVNRTWFYQSDCRRSSDVHVFEFLHFQHGLRVSHVDIALIFHETCLACPDIELRLYRRKNNADIVPSPSKAHSQTSFSGNVGLEEIEMQCDLLAGPYHCAEYADLNSHSAKVQLPGIVFLPQLIKKAGNLVGFKSASYYLVLRALSDFSLDQAVTAVKINERDKLKGISTAGKTKSASKRRIDDNESAEPAQSSAENNSAHGLTSRRGIQWIDELVITVVKARKAIEANERIERRALIETTDLHSNIVMLAAGIAPKISSAQKARTEGEKLQQQTLAIGIIEWLIDNWINTSSQTNLSAFAEMIIENVDAIFVNCFIMSPRSISHKWSGILMYILRVLRKSDDAAFSKLLQIFLSCSIRIITNLHAVRNAGSLHWLFVFIFALLKMAVMKTNDVSCGELLNTLLNAFSNTLTFVGIAWKHCWNGSVHEKLATEYGLSGLPTELVMYEWPRSVLSVWERTTAAAKLNDPSELAHAFPPATPTLIAYKWASAAAGYGKGYSEMKSAQNAGISRHEKIPTTDCRILNRDFVDANTNISGLTAADEIDWLALFNISTDCVRETFENPAEASSAANSQREYKYQTVTTSTQLSGLLETEPLTFAVIYASDHIKVENVETGSIKEVDCTCAPIGHTENEGPMPLKIMDITETILNKKSEREAGSSSVASKSGLQDLSADLNARMTLIAMEQAQTKEDNAVVNAEQSSHRNIEAVAQGFATQGSSASTFGIPTTPKTTPFMTPTPLSPSHLSPINSEPNLTYMMENESTNADEQSKENSNRRAEIRSQIPSLAPMISPDIFKLPSQKLLLMERITFGSRKFVILDFGVPILLTDFFIPSVAEIAAISLDVWLLGENVDGQRLLMTTDICRKSIAVQDLQPFMRIRFIKITYVGRQLYNAACKIPIGFFFGHRYFPSWQIHSYPLMQKEYFAHCMATNQQKKATITLSHLRQLCEDLRCRHQLASVELNRLVDEFAPEEEVKQVYRECVQLSLQWNIVVGVVHRLELDQLPSYSADSDQNLEKALHGSWNDCCPDQLLTIAVELFALVTRATHLVDVRAIALETFTSDNKASQNCCPSEAKYARIKYEEMREANLPLPPTEEIILHPVFSLDDAVTLFVLFCVPAVPRLQVGCITWLFHNGSESDWWPLFFPRVLKEVFSTQLKRHDHKIFLQLSFLCNHSVKSSSKQAAIILELFNLIEEIATVVLRSHPVDSQNQNKLDVTLLCWSLMLLSSAFDVVAYNKKKNDRWAFIGGEYSRVLASNEKDDSVSKWQKKRLLKFGHADEKTTNSLKNITSATLKTQLETLWEKHLKVMEAMKANMKMTKALNAKMQKKTEMEKKIHGLAPPSKMGQPALVETDFPAELKEDLQATLLPFFAEQQTEEFLVKKHTHQQSFDLKTSADSSESALKKAISMASKNNPRSRHRQYSIRLKLPHEPCLEVARKLVFLLCNFEKQLPILAKLIICKVVARICISASHHTIPLVCVLEGPIDKLIRVGLEEQRTGLLKYAILHLILDVIEAESRAVFKSNSSSKNYAFVKARDLKASEISKELDLLCMHHTGYHFDDLLRAKSKNEKARDVDGRKSTGITAAVCCLPETFHDAKTSRSFSIANYDEQPDLGSELLETLIYQLLMNTRQAVVPDGPSDEIRSHTYRRKAKEIISEKLARGEQFCYVFRWIDDLLEADEQAAHSCNGDAESYMEMMEKQTSENTAYIERTTTSKSAFIACCISECMHFLDSERNDSTHGLVFFSPAAEPASSSPSAPGSPILHTTDTEMKESEHKAPENDDGIKMMKDVDDFADSVSQDIAKAGCVCDCDHLEEEPSSDFAVQNAETSMETEQCSSSSSAFSESKMKKGMEKWVPVKWMSKISLNKEVYVEHIMASFLGELRLTKNDILVQPCSFVYPDHLTQQLGLNQHVHCMNMDLLADVITRYSVRDLSRWRTSLLCRPRLPEDETTRAQLGETLNATSAALGRFVHSITSSDSDETVQQILNFCLDFDAGLIYSTKKLPLVGKCILPAECATSIVNFAVTSTSLSEHLWMLVLRVLDLIMRNDSTATTLLIKSPHFCKLINNFLVKSIVRVNQSLTTGPSTICAFKSFIGRLHEVHDVSLRDVLCVKILTVLKDISSQQDDLINFAYPIDCLVELLNIVSNYESDYASVAPQELAAYISSSIHTARNFIHYYKSSGGYTLISAESYLRPNICFQAIQKVPVNAHYGCENADLSHHPYMAALWGQCGPHYSPLADQFSDTKRSPATRGDSSSRFPSLLRWQHQSNMFRQVSCYLDRSNEVSDHLLSNFPVAVEELFEIVAGCESAVPDVNLISLEDWNHVTLGDHALSMLLKISQHVSYERQRLFEIAVQVITRCASSSSYSLSKPLAFAFVQMLDSKHNQICFAKLGGHLIVARELEHSILASSNDWTAPISAPLMRQLASLSAQVAGSGEYGWSAPKLQTDVRDDGLYNYAPLCTVTSEQTPNVSGQLLSLIAVAAPRRTRSANWSYHFNEGGSDWFDITLNLPYHIILHEVQIRPHVPALSTAPSAVQVELCSETSLTQWCNLGAPLSTMGYSKIRISTDSYKLPVIAVRLYFKKPPDSTNLSLSQILLLGMNFTTSLSYTCPRNTDFVQWLSIMVQVCNLEKYCIWQYASELPRAVIALFLGRPLSNLVYHRISELFCQIDHERAKPYSIVELIFQYIEQGNTVTSESLEWLPNLLFTLCAQKPSLQEDTIVTGQKQHQVYVVKQCQVLLGVTSIITSLNYKKPLRDVAAVLIWTASCIIWHNINVEERRFDTLAICMDLTPQLLPFLCEMAIDASEQCNDTLAKSASWLLCSLMRGAPHLLRNALKEIGLLDINDKPKIEGITQNAFTVVQRMCQSRTSITQLQSFGLLQHWVELIITFCEETNMEHMLLLVSIVRCLASLCCIEDVVKFLDFVGGSRLFNSLIKCVVRCAATPGDMTRSSGKQGIKLEDATISLLSQCVTVGGSHRQRIAHALCSLLKSAGGLSGAIQQMVLKCIFDDEMIPVKAIDEHTSVCFLSLDIPNRILHPFFGCTRRERFLKVSLYTSMDEMSALCEHKNTCDFRQLAKIAVPVDESHRFSSVVNSRDLATAFPPFTSSRLMVRSSDGIAEMMGNWKIGQLLGDLFASGRLTSSAWKQKMAGGDTTKAAVEDSADGYYTVALSFVQRPGSTAINAISCQKPNVMLTEQTSTLQYFARASGLALLSLHLQVQHPAFNARTTAASSSDLKKKSSEQRWLIDSSETVPMNEMLPSSYACPTSIFSSPDLSTGEPLYSTLYVPFFGGEADLNSGYEDFEYIDSAASGEVKGWTYCPLFSQTESSGNHTAFKKLPKTGSQPSNRVLSTGLSPHVIVAFSIFLRLEGYAELLVTYDRKRAKGLLRLAMGVITAETALANRPRMSKPGIFRRAAQSQFQSRQKSECESLGSLPFVVLEELFNKHLPCSAAGKSLREAAVTSGILDILLDCLSHYTHQKHKERSIRPSYLQPAPEAAVLVEHLLRTSVEAEQSFGEGANFGLAAEERVNNSESTGTAVTSSNVTQQHNFWAKGTGFGSGTTQQQWNVDLHVLKRKQDEQNVTHLLRVLSCFIYPRIGEYLEASKNHAAGSSENVAIAPLASLDSEDTEVCSRSQSISPMSVSDTVFADSSMPGPSAEQESHTLAISTSVQWSLSSAVVKMLSRSCLLPAIWAYLRNDSVLDISQHVELYEAVMHMVAALALSPEPTIRGSEEEDGITALLSEPESGYSMHSMLKKLFDCISAYLTRLAVESNETRLQNLNIQQTADSNEESTQAREEGLMRLAPLITTVCVLLSKRIRELPMSSENDEKDAVTEEEKYMKVMKDLQFETISFFTEGSFIPYHYESSLSSVGTNSSLGKRTRRLAQEIVTLSNSLPLSSSSSVFVRACEERLDVMKVLITGPADTPYMNGCFEFDVWFPADYPNSPMHVNLETTGNHTVRFNPNLYNDGKVCLSVLNTWHGRPEERWNPETSSLLQVIVSVQSLILVAEPYFNEPGYERSKCTQAGQQASRDYDANIRQAVVKWAMLEMIRHPPPAFADIVKKHFWLKRKEILSQVSRWINEMEQLVKQQRSSGRSIHGHLASLKRHAAALEDEYRRLECPAGLQEISVLSNQQTNISKNIQASQKASEQQPRSPDTPEQIPHGNLKSLSVMKILKL